MRRPPHAHIDHRRAPMLIKAGYDGPTATPATRSLRGDVRDAAAIQVSDAAT
jgi:predicted metal-dependent RNase